MKQIKLLPRGQFILTLHNDQEVKGRFSMVAIDRFCDIKKIESYFTLLQHIAIGMSIKDYALFISCALQDYHRNDYNNAPFGANEVMDMLDQLEKGFSDPSFKGLIRHGISRITELKEEEPGKAVDPEDQKKNLMSTTDLPPASAEPIQSEKPTEQA